MTREKDLQAAVCLAAINGDQTELERLLREDMTRDQLVSFQQVVSKINRALWNARAGHSAGYGGKT